MIFNLIKAFYFQCKSHSQAVTFIWSSMTHVATQVVQILLFMGEKNLSHQWFNASLCKYTVQLNYE